MHLFGVTGGIASGKSTVAKRLRARGVPVIDADALAREVVVLGSPALAEIQAAFGTRVLASDGSLDRRALASIVFDDDALRRKLNAITHPRISLLTMQRTAELGAKGEPLAAYEAALIVENGVEAAFRPLVVVAAPEDVQLARIRSRDVVSEADAMARLRAQKPLAEKTAVADYVIDTGGTLEDNARRTDEVLAAVCAKLGIDIARYPMR